MRCRDKRRSSSSLSSSGESSSVVGLGTHDGIVHAELSGGDALSSMSKPGKRGKRRDTVLPDEPAEPAWEHDAAFQVWKTPNCGTSSQLAAGL
jgi:hypothetical protein